MCFGLKVKEKQNRFAGYFPLCWDKTAASTKRTVLMAYSVYLVVMNVSVKSPLRLIKNGFKVVEFLRGTMEIYMPSEVGGANRSAVLVY